MILASGVVGRRPISVFHRFFSFRFFSFGHVWVVLAVRVPLPLGGTRGFATPILFRLFVGAQWGDQRDAASRATTGAGPRAAQAAYPPASQQPTKLQLARELIALAAAWAADRRL